MAQKAAMQQILFAGDSAVEENDFLQYGPVKVLKGKYKRNNRAIRGIRLCNEAFK